MILSSNPLVLRSVLDKQRTEELKCICTTTTMLHYCAVSKLKMDVKMEKIYMGFHKAHTKKCNVIHKLFLSVPKETSLLPFNM